MYALLNNFLIVRILVVSSTILFCSLISFSNTCNKKRNSLLNVFKMFDKYKNIK